MGYFSNGAEGMDYEDAYCSKCIHNDAAGPYCPVWALHKQFNYEECNKPDSFLHILIPRMKDGMGNERCKMFVPAPSMGLDLGKEVKS